MPAMLILSLAEMRSAPLTIPEGRIWIVAAPKVALNRNRRRLIPFEMCFFIGDGRLEAPLVFGTVFQIAGVVQP